MKIEHPLWEKLLKVNKVAANRFPTDLEDPGFGALGLILHSKPKRYDYWCTPKNVLTFATTGGDGVHFSFLVSDGEVSEASPVVITIPVPAELENYIVGQDLFDFLCLGVHRGYFALATLPDHRVFEAYGSPAWQPKTDSDFAMGFGVNEHQRKLLGFLKEEFSLMPWTNLKHKFDRLQETYSALLELP